MGDGSLLDAAQKVVTAGRRIEALYPTREFGQVICKLSLIADIGNETIESPKPWGKLKQDAEAARLTCTFAMNVWLALAMYLWPIVPSFAETGARLLGVKLDATDVKQLFTLRAQPLSPLERLFERIDKAAIDAVVQASMAKEKPAVQPPNIAQLKEETTHDAFHKIDLRVGKCHVGHALDNLRT